MRAAVVSQARPVLAEHKRRMAKLAAHADLGFEEEVLQAALTDSAKAGTAQKMSGNRPRKLVLKTSGMRRKSGLSGKSSSGKNSVISLRGILTRVQMLLGVVVLHQAAAQLVPARVREQLLDSPLLTLINPHHDHLQGLPVQLHERHILNFSVLQKMQSQILKSSRKRIGRWQ